MSIMRRAVVAQSRSIGLGSAAIVPPAGYLERAITNTLELRTLKVS
jgi:hypothetical protein